MTLHPRSTKTSCNALPDHTLGHLRRLSNVLGMSAICPRPRTCRRLGFIAPLRHCVQIHSPRARRRSANPELIGAKRWLAGSLPLRVAFGVGDRHHVNDAGAGVGCRYNRRGAADDAATECAIGRGNEGGGINGGRQQHCECDGFHRAAHFAAERSVGFSVIRPARRAASV
jgi:hypothetical protein